MTFLPIVERELRVTARRRNTYWMRTAVALGAIVIGAAIYVACWIDPLLNFGKILFWALAGLCLFFCLLAGRYSTADCLSKEKREGTLGLLFLTDLKGYDVVFGKLVATSLNGFYGLLAAFPVLAVPLLVGGMTSGEFWRMVLVLVSVFLFSLTLGIAVSSVTQDARAAMGANLLLFLILAALPPVVASVANAFLSSHPLWTGLFWSCPICPFSLCPESQYWAYARHFWGSLAVIHGFTWLFVLLACRIAPRSWQDRPVRSRSLKSRWPEFLHACSYGRAAHRPAFRKRLLDVNAFYWLAARARLKPAHVWLFLALLPLWWIGGWLIFGNLWLDEANLLVTAFILNTTLKVWIASEAGRQLSEDRNAGALELLLSTSLTVRDILRGQFLALRRQFLKPLFAAISLELCLMVIWLRQAAPPKALAIWLAGLLMLVADMVALSWVALAAALVARTPGRATFSAVGRILIFPLILFGVVALMGSLWSALVSPTGWAPGWQFYLAWWFILGILADLFFGLVARRQFLAGLRRQAGEQFTAEPLPRTASPIRLAGVARNAPIVRPQSTPAPPASRPASSRTRRALALALVVIVPAVCGLIRLERPRNVLPPPVVVPLSRGNAPLRVFASGNGLFLILPDNSLWGWGRQGPQPSRTPVPQRIGTNSDWAQVSALYDFSVGLRTDGTLWEWGRRSNGRLVSVPEQVDPSHDWIAVSAGGAHALALKRDGTLWAWGVNKVNQLGNGPGPNHTNLVQVGADHDWAAVRCTWACTFALRTDGTLWAWGQAFTRGGGLPANMTLPSRLCRDTDWIGFADGMDIWVRNRAGELWEPLFTNPHPEASAAAIFRRVILPSASTHSAFAVRYGVNPSAECFEVRSNGTLWATPCSWLLQLTATPANWRQVGSRSDWISVSGDFAVVGLTRDGTLWTWGTDPGQEPVIGFQSRFKSLTDRITGRPGSGPAQAYPPFQKEPRPLMRLVPANPQEPEITHATR
jgi:ABC-2 family transporter protein/Regulator of chromosome condensation (RCC1) repeat